jgi:hypothetical protein
MHDDGRDPLLYRRESAELCSHLPRRYHRGSGLQQGVHVPQVLLHVH